MKKLLLVFSIAIFSCGALTETVLTLNGELAQSIYSKWKTDELKLENQGLAKRVHGLLKCHERINQNNYFYRCSFAKNSLELDGKEAQDFYQSLNIGIIKKPNTNWKGAFGVLTCLSEPLENLNYRCSFELSRSVIAANQQL